jgi:hypothetical protein
MSKTVNTLQPTRGRPPKRSPETVQKILEKIRKGLSLRSAAAAGGISVASLHEWRKQDPDFEAAVQQAMSDSEESLFDLAKAGAAKDGRIALMMLARRFPDDWEKRPETASQHLHLHGAQEILEKLTSARRRIDEKERQARQLTGPAEAEIVAEQPINS